MTKPTTEELATLTLMKGGHHSRENGMCIMEATAWLADEPHSDHPECVCPVIAAFARNWNDSLSDEDRNRLLKPILPRLVGTRATKAVELRRSWMAVDWLVHESAPAWMDLTESLKGHAAKLRALPAIDCATAAGLAQVTLNEARSASDAAWAAARAAARAAAWDAAKKALAPTVTAQQASALDLLERMIACA